MNSDKLEKTKEDLMGKGEDYPSKNMYHGVSYLDVLWRDW